jgi:hypothetical protein
MTDEELENWESVKYRMEEEGFHYCFKHYSRFDEIKDIEFHRLRLNYLESSELLEKYINDKYDEGNDELNF